LIHDSFAVGTALWVGPPVNSFALDHHASTVLLLAAGIGVTPLLSMTRSLLRRKRRFRMVYSGRSLDQMAYAHILKEMCGDALELHTRQTDGRLDFASVLAQQDTDTQAYVCGPSSFIDAAKQAVQALRWAPERLRSEAFVTAVRPGDTAFEVALKRSNRVVQVRADQSLLDALSHARVPVLWDCRKGECGLCAAKVLSSEGGLFHRDRYLSEEEKKQGHLMCLCVSRTSGQSLVLDL